MKSTIVEVKANVGDRNQIVKIISRDVIDDSIIDFMKNMTLDKVRRFGTSRGWSVSVVND